MDKLELDTMTPACTSLLVDKRDKVLLAHGGSVLGIGFETVSGMDIPTFLKEEVPKLGDANRSFYVVRDISSGEVTLIYKDSVFRYDNCVLDEVPMDKLAAELQTTTRLCVRPGSQYPTVELRVDDAFIHYTVDVPPRTFNYKCKDVFGPEHPGVTITTPPLLVSLRVTTAGTNPMLYLACHLDSSPDMRGVELYSWPLANVMPFEAQVCFGEAVMTTPVSNQQQTIGSLLSRYLELFLLCDHNNHVVPDVRMDKLAARYKQCPKDDFLQAALDRTKDNDYRKVIMTLRILKDPNGWRTMVYRKGSFAKSFITQEARNENKLY